MNFISPAGLRGPRFAVALVACLVVIALLWNTPFLLPLRWLVVLFHELSHAAMGWCTGGHVVSLNITHRESGICLVAGGNRTLILLAGYPGSLCWGLAAIFLARSGRFTGVALVLLGGLLGLVALGWVRPLLGFGFPFALGSGALLLVAGVRGAPWLREAVLLAIGATSCAYALIDIQQDVFGGRACVSDATLLAEHTWIPFWFWGLLWYGLSMAILVVVVRGLFRAEGRLNGAPERGIREIS